MTTGRQDYRVPIVSFVGRSRSGKTTLIERLIPLLQQRGYRVGVIKHTLRQNIETDIAGTDTRRMWDAGADHVTFVTVDRIVHTQRYAAAPTLEMALADVNDVDLVIAEGFKHGPFPKIEVTRAACDPQLIPDVEGRIACVTDIPGLACDLPHFGPDDVAALADFIVNTLIRGV